MTPLSIEWLNFNPQRENIIHLKDIIVSLFKYKTNKAWRSKTNGMHWGFASHRLSLYIYTAALGMPL